MSAEHVERKSAVAPRGTVPSPFPSPQRAVSESVAYPGPVGSHTASAAAALFPSAQLVPLPGFRAVVQAVTDAEYKTWLEQAKKSAGLIPPDPRVLAGSDATVRSH